MFKSLVTEVLGVGAEPVESGASLRDFEWKYRVLVIVQDKTGIEAAAQADSFMAQADALRERDLVLISVAETSARVLFGPTEALTTTHLDAGALLSDLDAAPGSFHIALIGKDGTVKLTSDRPVDPSSIFSRIDQMPMRKDEMRH
ncbi:hypothetical protein BJF92_01775 [Rhizobium rhizosphaerae]|uniref:DUF4174 domain-containing protein n=1 Tax=Xaviernesmea rhizosphaerae TaxID=1672749 RepID=A0A1Q9AKN5_9HYPH|nr:DUF4174 domain-containing protein [Xaviernesmea rhizosphaerae]OLP55866.1 hypothetical protein BJF92_01775 [Xaviernesmea rhizosphaerae]